MASSRSNSRSASEDGAPVSDLSRVDAVLRTLRGEDVETLAQEFEVSTETVMGWRDQFLAAGVSRLDQPDNARSTSERTPTQARRRGTVGSPRTSERSGDWRHQAADRTGVGLPPTNEPGLRERKKAKTREAIREQAMRLFSEQGYDATTINEIAAAAELSPSTFFRYFATKEDVVFEDMSDAMLIEHFHAQPRDLSPVEAAFRALLSGTASTASEDNVRKQTLLCLSVPDLRSALFDNMTQLMARIGDLVAEREGRDPNDLAVKTFAAAVQGVWMSTLFDWAEDPEADLTSSMETAMSLLERGIPL